MKLVYRVKQKEKTSSQRLMAIKKMELETPEEIHKSIIETLYNQQKMIDFLLQDNKELWGMIQKYENTNSTQSLVEKIWDNKEDEFWDTF